MSKTIPEGFSRNLPCPVGAEFGREFTRLLEPAIQAYRERNPEGPDLCHSCAFRSGSVPNQCVTTMATAFKCVMEREEFCCHEGKDGDGNPTQVCRGWLAAMEAHGDKPPIRVPWDFPEVPE